MRRTRELVITITFVGSMLALAAYAVPRVRLDPNIAAMLPESEATAPELRAAIALSRGSSSRTVLMELTPAASAQPISEEVAARYATLIARSPVTRWVASRDAPEELARVARLVDEHPEAFGGPELPPTRDTLDETMLRMRALLASPIAADHVAHLRRDPLLSRLRAWESFEGLGTAVGERDDHGRLRSRDGRSVIEAFGLVAGAEPADVERLMSEVRTQASADGIDVRWSGAAPIGAAATSSIRGDIERVSIASTCGVFVFLALVFGRLRYVLVAALPLLAATVTSLACAVAVFGAVHGIAMAFGGAMIGVVIDYVEHFLAHRALRPHDESADETLRSIRPSLNLAALTTCVGVGGFAFASYPGFRAITVIAVSGVAAGLVTTLYVVPIFAGVSSGPTRAQRALATWSRAFTHLLRRTRRFMPWLAVVLVAFVVSRLSGAEMLDDPMALAGIPPGLLSDDAKVRADLGASMDWVVATEGRSCDEALGLAERDAARLAAGGATIRVTGPTRFPGSVASQSDRTTKARAVPPELLREGLETNGFDAAAFSAFFDWRERSDARTFSLPELASVAPLLFESTYVAERTSCWIVSRVSGASEAWVRGRLDGRGASTVVSARRAHAEVYQRMVGRIAWVVASGMLAVFLVCFVRYRRVRTTFAAFFPAVLAAGTALAAATTYGPLDLMHGLGALLVVSMGVDYGIFFVDSRHADPEVDATFGSVVISALTNVLSFGVLGLSNHRALASLGFVTSLGVVLSVVLAPTALTLISDEGRDA